MSFCLQTHVVCMSDELLYASLFPLPAVHSVFFYPETSTVSQLLFLWFCTWIHHPLEWQPAFQVFLSDRCLNTACFSVAPSLVCSNLSLTLLFPPENSNVQICPAPSSGHIMHRQMLSEISLAMHIWHPHPVMLVFSFMWRSSLMPSHKLSAPLPCPQLKSQGLVSFSLKTICTTPSLFFWSYVYLFLYFRDVLNKLQKLNILLHWIW